MCEKIQNSDISGHHCSGPGCEVCKIRSARIQTGFEDEFHAIDGSRFVINERGYVSMGNKPEEQIIDKEEKFPARILSPDEMEALLKHQEIENNILFGARNPQSVALINAALAASVTMGARESLQHLIQGNVPIEVSARELDVPDETMNSSPYGGKANQARPSGLLMGLLGRSNAIPKKLSAGELAANHFGFDIDQYDKK